MKSNGYYGGGWKPKRDPRFPEFVCLRCKKPFLTPPNTVLGGDNVKCPACRVKEHVPRPRPVRPTVMPTAGALKRHKITMAQFNTMVRRQNGLCAICLRLPSEWVIDHNHNESRKVRGALCKGCNTAIGILGDDPETLRRAADYLDARGNYANQNRRRSTIDPALVTDPRFTKRYYSRKGSA